MKTFKRIYIEITNSCNLSCSFCPPTKREGSFMSVEDFETILKRLEGHGHFIYLHVKGEPMMHPKFSEILALCEAYGMKVNLTTNGTLIGQYHEVLISSKAIRQISVSLQSQENLADQESFHQYMTEVLTLVEEGRRRSEIIFELRLWNYEASIDGPGSDKNQIAMNRIIEQLEVSEEVIKAIPQGKGTKLGYNVYLSKSLEFQWPAIDLEVISRSGTCYGLRQQVGILVNGDVVPCCLDGEGVITLGNCFDSSFESIVMSSRATAMVKGFEQRKIVEPLCRRCGYRERF